MVTLAWNGIRELWIVAYATRGTVGQCGACIGRRHMVRVRVMRISVLRMGARGIRIAVGDPSRVPDWVVRVGSRLPSHLILGIIGIRVG